jgi:archaeosortase C (PEF-CTERM variant)
MKFQKKWALLPGLIMLFGGLDVLILVSHTSRFVGLALFIAGGTLVYYSAGGLIKEEQGNLGSKIMSSLTLDGRLLPLFPAAGLSLIIFVVFFNLRFTGALDLGSHDYVTLLLGITLLAYGHIPGKYDFERDWLLLFFTLLFLILVVPLTVHEIMVGGASETTNSPFIYYLLAKPVASFVSLLGVPAEAYNDPIRGVLVSYMLKTGGTDEVIIGISCTGLYSVSIFISAFTAFILLEYNRLDRKVAVLLTAGVITAYVANILRMSIIVMVGSYYGPAALLWTHNNLGTFIFLGWITLFWGAAYRYLDIKNPENEE